MTLGKKKDDLPNPVPTISGKVQATGPYQRCQRCGAVFLKIMCRWCSLPVQLAACYLFPGVKTFIPRQWKLPQPLTLEEGLTEISHTHYIEGLTAHTPREVGKPEKTWFYWMAFQTSPTYSIHTRSSIPVNTAGIQLHLTLLHTVPLWVRTALLFTWYLGVPSNLLFHLQSPKCFLDLLF